MSAAYHYRLECEAREWIERVRAEGHTKASGKRRMDGILADIERVRGKSEAHRLSKAIQRQLERGAP